MRSQPPDYTSTPGKPTDPLERLRAIDWFQFEKVFEVFYRKLGYRVIRRGGANPDGGIDLIVNKHGERTAIQCEHWKAWKVDVRGIREFLAALTQAGIQPGIFIPIRGYTSEARELAGQHAIQIIDETGSQNFSMRWKHGLTLNCSTF